MKALILSDVHSNICALEAIWEREKDSDVIYCTGDLVDYGPFPREVIAWVRDHGAVCMQGNHDRYVAEIFRQGIARQDLSPEKRAWAHHNAWLLEEHEVAFLESLPEALAFELDGFVYGLTHLYREYEVITSLHAFEQFRSRRFRWTGSPITRLILGHTHRRGLHYLSDTIFWLNPGSASYRRRDDPDQTAHYAVIVDGAVSLRSAPYDLSPLRQAVENVDLMASEVRTVRWFFGPR